MRAVPNATYLDIHVLQTLPYANANRDDLGSPKTVVYGGRERTRISSQSWKRVVRHQVEERLGDPAVRTRRLISAIAARLEARGWSRETAELGGRQVVLSTGKGIKLEKEKDGEPPVTSVLFYLPVPAIDALADLVAEHAEEIGAEAKKKKPSAKGVLPADRVERILREGNATVQLFGRMLAELPSAEVDGAVQFAHAFTVHGTSVEVDFFTAVDDIPKENDRGSGHMNAGEFSTGTFYRYANVNLDRLLANLGGDRERARELVGEFLRAFLETVPSGKQNATGAMTVPDLAHVAVRSDRPVSFAPAFEQPVWGEAGFAEPARARMDDYAGQLAKLWWDDTALFRGYAGLDTGGKEPVHLGGRHGGYPALIGQALASAYGEAAGEAGA